MDEKEKREEYEHLMRKKILNNDNLDYVTKDVLLDIFDMAHNATIDIQDIFLKLRDIQTTLKDRGLNEGT